MSTPRELFAQADELRATAMAAKSIATLTEPGHQGAIRIGRIEYYRHPAYPRDEAILDAINAAMEDLISDYNARADNIDAAVMVVQR